MIGTLPAVEGWITDLQRSMADVPAELEAAVPDGDFASVLARVGSVLGTGPDASTGTGATGTGTGTVPATGAGTATADGAGTASAIGGSVTGQDVVAEATTFLGTPYVWGGASPPGFDCSGLVQYVYGQLGVSLPRTSEEQATVGTPVASLAQAVPGDLVFFAGSDGTATAPGHVGIYVGDGKMIDAPQTGTVVQVQTVSAAGTPVAIRQVLPTAGSSGTAGAWAAGGLSGSAGAVTGTPGQDTAATSTGATGTGGVPSTLAPLFVAAAGRYGVPVTLLTAVARQESGFDPDAVSSAGAEGIMQLMPSTAAGLDVNPFDPAQAIDGAAQLLSGYLAQFSSVPLALAAYNAGPAAVQQYGGVPPYPQTQAYVDSIMQAIGGTA